MGDFTPKDRTQIELHGLQYEEVCAQIKVFQENIPFVKLEKPATLGDGILKFSEKAIAFYQDAYENFEGKVVKFVPASGAATRMFKSLLAYVDGCRDDAQMLEQVNEFKKGLPKFAFYETLLLETKKVFSDFETLSEARKFESLCHVLLDKEKLNYGSVPKGLVPFHSYENEIRTAFEEHFSEAKSYAEKEQQIIIHFTVDKNHLAAFKKEDRRLKEKWSARKTSLHFQTSFSFQAKSSDTIAVDMDNKPFRDAGGNLVFRPSGHGALLDNLNQIDADIVFVKNIDNVSMHQHREIEAKYKQALAGYLVTVQQEIFTLLDALTKDDLPENELDQLLAHAAFFCEDYLSIEANHFRLQEMIALLHRPIRVCGMVENTGAPGGGPFWVKNATGQMSLQIVELAQIDKQDPSQAAHIASATHFNPVDLVCGLRDFKGNKFELTQFSDPSKQFISKKSLHGKALKALELPGLWNGAMDGWNTIFVEVPLETFTPVKTVNDLLKTPHQSVRTVLLKKETP